MKKLSDKARLYARSYGQLPYGREIEGTAELLLQMAEKLEEYGDLEEQGKLLKLPCAVGDTVYRINKGAKEPIILMKVCEVGVVSLKSGGFVMQIMCRDELDNGETHYLSTDFGKAVFLTREEAEAVLKALQKG